MAAELYNNSDKVRLLEQANHYLLQENTELREQNARTQVAYERAKAERQATDAQFQALQVQHQALQVQHQDAQVQLRNVQDQLDAEQQNNEVLRQENQAVGLLNQGLQDRVVALEFNAAQRDAREVERDAREGERDAQIAFLMARLNPPQPQQPVLLVPHNQLAPVLLPAPPPLLVGEAQELPPAPLSVAIQTPRQAPPIARPNPLPTPRLVPPAPVIAPAQMAVVPAPLPPLVQEDDYEFPSAPGVEIGVPAPVPAPTETERRIIAELANLSDYEADQEIAKNPWKYRYLSEMRRDNEKTLYIALGKKEGGRGRVDMFGFATQRLKDSCGDDLALSSCNNHAFLFATNPLKNNPDFALRANSINDVGDELKSDKNIGLHFVRKDPYDFKHLSVELRGDIDVLFAAFETADYGVRQGLLQYASPELQQDVRVLDAVNGTTRREDNSGGFIQGVIKCIFGRCDD